MKHYLVGKARSLEDALSVMKSRLKEMGFTLTQHHWLNPVPGVWSVHVKAEQCPALFANGKGVSREAALASAYGEFLERLLTGYFYGDYALPCNALDYTFVPDEVVKNAQTAWRDLPGVLRSFWSADEQLDPVEKLPSLSCCGTGVRCVPLKPLHGATESIEVPWNVLMNFYGSNGLCAGNTEREAQVQGLSEIFERWVRQEIIRRNVCLPEVPEEAWATSEAVVQAKQALSELGIEISIRDASLGEGYPVIAIILFEVGKGRAFVSFGAHPIMRVAIERTLTEAFQGRRLDDLSVYQPPSDDLDWVQSWENLELHFIDASGQFHWHFFSDTPDIDWRPWGLDEKSALDAQWHYLLDCLSALEHPLYGATYSVGDFYACRLIAPGMSEVFPPWELIENNQNEGCALRQHLLDFDDSTNWCEQLIDMIDGYGWAPHQSVASTAGLLVSASSGWRGEKMIDLQLRAALALKDFDLVDALLPEAKLLSQGDPLREGAWHYVSCWRLGERLDGVARSMRRLYGPAAFAAGRALVSGAVWQGLRLGSELLSDPVHQALIQTHPGFKKRISV